MDDITRNRVYEYAKYYHSTSGKQEYLRTIGRNLGKEYLDESDIAWEAIDQWEGEVNPR